MSDQLTDEGLGRLRAVARRHVGDDRVPGLVALVACGDQVHAEALGTLSIGGAPVARDSLFRIASTTKPITAAATLALAGEGLLDLDAPIDAVLPELADRRVLTRMDGPLDDTVPARRAITTRDLLTRSEEHTSELQSQFHLVCRLLLEKKKTKKNKKSLFTKNNNNKFTI